MMDFLFHSFTGMLSVLLPTLASLVRFRKTERTFLPFLLLMPLGLLSELSSYLVLLHNRSNAVVTNLYVLAEAVLITWQFRQWGAFDRKRRPGRFYLLLQAGYLLWWLYESFVIGSLSLVHSYFILGASFCVVVMSADMLSKQVVGDYNHLRRNARFWICLGFILYFTSSLITEVFWVYGLQQTAPFRNMVVTVMLCINLLANLIYTYAIRWVPTRFRYLAPW